MKPAPCSTAPPRVEPGPEQHPHDAGEHHHVTASLPHAPADPVAESDVVLRQFRLAHRHERIDVAEVGEVAERLAGLELAEADRSMSFRTSRQPLTSADPALGLAHRCEPATGLHRAPSGGRSSPGANAEIVAGIRFRMTGHSSTIRKPSISTDSARIG